jgi:hypothetical protein
MVARFGHIALNNDTVGKHKQGRRATQSPKQRPLKALPVDVDKMFRRLMPIGDREGRRTIPLGLPLPFQFRTGFPGHSDEEAW